jgi:hypothetical protein
MPFPTQLGWASVWAGAETANSVTEASAAATRMVWRRENKLERPRLGEEIGIHKIVSLDDLAGYDPNGSLKSRTVVGEGVKLASFATRVDLRRQIVQKVLIELASGE